jgi:hypothetical protein
MRGNIEMDKYKTYCKLYLIKLAEGSLDHEIIASASK